MAVIGVDIGGTSIKAGLVEKGEILKRIEISTFTRSSTMHLFDKLVELIDQLNSKDVTAIGIGFPALVEEGTVYEGVNVKWDKFPLQDLLKDKFKVPIIVTNDANCFAIGEQKFGSARGFQNVVGITLGTGVGAGLIMHDKLHPGFNGGAGEIGRIPYCDGTLEQHCASQFFEKHGMSGKELAFQAEKNDKRALKLFHEYGKNVAIMLSIVINTVDPHVIVLGGAIAKSYDYFEDSMKGELKKHIPSVSYDCLHIYTAENVDSGILGAAHLAKSLKNPKRK